MAAPKSITPHTKFQSEVYILKKEEGAARRSSRGIGRSSTLTMDVTGESELLAGVEMVMSGNVNLIVTLIVPVLEVGSHFAIREGGRTVGAGVITKIIE